MSDGNVAFERGRGRDVEHILTALCVCRYASIADALVKYTPCFSRHQFNTVLSTVILGKMHV